MLLRALQGIVCTDNMTEPKDEMNDLRKALELAVCKIVFDEDSEQGTRTTRSAIAALTELTFQYATKSLIPDLYIFSTHANRKSTISPDDVAVVLRKLQPDQLETFKRNFCRCGKKTLSSKSNAAIIFNGNEDGRRKLAITAGRRRKRNETEVLSLSSSTSSCDDYERAHDNVVDSKLKPAAYMRSRNFKSEKYAGGTSSGTSSSVAFTTRRSRSNASSLSMEKNSTIGKSTERESLLNKFQLQSDTNSCIYNKDTFDYDTSSTDDNNITRFPSRGLGLAKTARSKPAVATTTAKGNMISQKYPLQGIQSRKSNAKQLAKKRPKSNSHIKNDSFLDGSDGSDYSSDDDDIFLSSSANKMKKNTDITNDQLLVNLIDENHIRSNSSRNRIQDLENDDQHGNARNSENGGINIGASKQSQVAEALANLSSDSGMDEVDSDIEDEILVNVGNNSSDRRHHPIIESDDDD